MHLVQARMLTYLAGNPDYGSKPSSCDCLQLGRAVSIFFDQAKGSTPHYFQVAKRGIANSGALYYIAGS
jgi:hypothetical protein